MRRWLALRLQGLVARLTRPVATQLSDRIDGAARDTRGEMRDVAASLLNAMGDLAARQAETERVLRAVASQVDGRLSELVERVGRTRHEIAEASGRDIASVIRLLAAAEADMVDLRTTLGRDGRGREAEPREATPSLWPSVRHVIYLGVSLAPETTAPEILLAALRTGLDASDDAGEGAPELWIERRRASDTQEAVGTLARDSYIRMLRGGTRSVEALRPDDVVALRAALDLHGRRDVRVVFRWCGVVIPEPGAMEEVVRRALVDADHWVFPSQDLADAVLEAYAPSPGDRSGKHVHVHALPDHATADPKALAAAYRASVAAILASDAADPHVPPL